MKYPKPQYEQLEIPRLDDQVKKMNGKSSKRLQNCIDKLSELLEESEGQDGDATDGTGLVRDLGVE